MTKTNGMTRSPRLISPEEREEFRAAFLDLLAHMTAAASAYRKFASRGRGVVPRSRPDAMFSTRVKDFEAAAARGRAFIGDFK